MLIVALIQLTLITTTATITALVWHHPIPVFRGAGTAAEVTVAQDSFTGAFPYALDLPDPPRRSSISASSAAPELDSFENDYPMGLVNPASGLPMTPGGTTDVAGNAFGSNWMDDSWTGFESTQYTLTNDVGSGFDDRWNDDTSDDWSCDSLYSDDHVFGSCDDIVGVGIHDW